MRRKNIRRLRRSSARRLRSRGEINEIEIPGHRGGITRVHSTVVCASLVRGGVRFHAAGHAEGRDQRASLGKSARLYLRGREERSRQGRHVGLGNIEPERAGAQRLESRFAEGG